MTNPDYTEEQRYLDTEYPENLAAKLRAADITNTDDLPAWAAEELMQNLLDYAPSFTPGNTLADRNPIAYSLFRAAMDEEKPSMRALTPRGAPITVNPSWRHGVPAPRCWLSMRSLGTSVIKRWLPT
ncbi:Uncharacterised protein [Mycobacteroides abscessus subsp. abscessus]|uniref:hypothetical protein n=1 Tax=Mycobacteroides abscessus TaxID=36809 RepID=UPI0009A6624B|nr:hypothetical protein [Mycobacteroides abscessus]SKU67160.1 Uncharacterised protein [Mycobacteroides abscessus subsp. abscessus]